MRDTNKAKAKGNQPDLAGIDDLVVGVGRAPGRVLVVDDEQPILTLIEQSLRQWGYAAVSASSALECTAIWNNHRDDITAAIIDLRLGNADGRDVAALLLRDKPDLNIIFMSGYPLETFNDPALVEGKNFIAKPFQVQVLQQLL